VPVAVSKDAALCACKAIAVTRVFDELDSLRVQAIVRLADRLKATTIVLAPHAHEFLDSLYHQSVRAPPSPRPITRSGGSGQCFMTGHGMLQSLHASEQCCKTPRAPAGDAWDRGRAHADSGLPLMHATERICTLL